MLVVLLMVACGATDPDPAKVPVVAEAPTTVAVAPTPVLTPVLTPAAPPAPPPSAPAAAPAGRIGGVPIVAEPVVLGAMSVDAVHAGIGAQLAAIRACYDSAGGREAGRMGKVLVRFIIAKDGAVSSTSTRSTSLRHPATEDCVNARVAEARFAAPGNGGTAIVSYPFTFPPN